MICTGFTSGICGGIAWEWAGKAPDLWIAVSDLFVTEPDAVAKPEPVAAAEGRLESYCRCKR